MTDAIDRSSRLVSSKIPVSLLFHLRHYGIVSKKLYWVDDDRCRYLLLIFEENGVEAIKLARHIERIEWTIREMQELIRWWCFTEFIAFKRDYVTIEEARRFGKCHYHQSMLIDIRFTALRFHILPFLSHSHYTATRPQHFRATQAAFVSRLRSFITYKQYSYLLL